MEKIIRNFIIICIFFGWTCSPMYAYNNIFNDVDSVGDLWVFTIDKTGSMLSERVSPYKKVSVTPYQISYSVLSRLNRSNGLLDCICYDRDKIAIYETGYGKKLEDSYGYAFDNAAPLEHSFIHMLQSPKVYKKNGKNGLVSVLRNYIEENDYYYKESFVSQIRVLTLSRIISYMREAHLQNTFRNIHLVIITDDAEENDQWRTDYYTIKFRSPKKMRELNTLHAKYIYSSFTQQGGGILDENDAYTDVSDARHLYRYDYITMQQHSLEPITDGVVRLAPMDGNLIYIRRAIENYNTDSVMFVYIDNICINGDSLQIDQYLIDSLCLSLNYENHVVNNDVKIKGQIQVAYTDSIYGAHAKKIPFVQHSTVMTTTSDLWLKCFIVIICICALGGLLWILAILPNTIVFTIYSGERQMRVRRGYKHQWNEGINPLIYNTFDKDSNCISSVMAKHSCYRVRTSIFDVNNNSLWFIDSPRPLRHSARAHLETINTGMRDMAHHIQRHDEYPLVLSQLYHSSILSSIDALADNKHKWIRDVSHFLHNLYHRICPHYLYWAKSNATKESILITSSLLPESPFLLEINIGKHLTINADDIKISSYYFDSKSAPAEVLVASTIQNDTIDWDVYLLQANIRLGHGIQDAKHLLHYSQSL